jgi:NitT/TauT family transport system ATP-binding protein
VIFVTHSVFESVYLSNRIVVMSTRPGRIIGEVAIDAPYPRDDAFRSSRTYHEFCCLTSAELARAMAGTEDEG